MLPPGFKRIRHYGLLSPAANNRDRIAAAHNALKLPEPSKPTLEAAESFMRWVVQKDISQCPCCGHGVLRVVADLLPSRASAMLAHTLHRTRIAEVHRNEQCPCHQIFKKGVWVSGVPFAFPSPMDANAFIARRFTRSHRCKPGIGQGQTDRFDGEWTKPASNR